MDKRISRGWCFLMIIILSLDVHAQDSRKKTHHENMAKIPVGWDAYRMWDQWPLQRMGVRAYMRSTYDRNGGNRDESNFLFANEEDHNVTLDIKGKGVLYFFRANHWHGSPWHFITDGKDNIVQETGTADPVNAKNIAGRKTSFIPSDALPQPLNWTWGTTKGADLIWTPMSFQKSIRIAYSRTHYGTGYYIYHLYANEKNLSQPISSWNIHQPPQKDVLDLIGRAGTDIAPKNIQKQAGQLILDKERVTVFKLQSQPSSIRAFRLTLPLEKALDLERLRLVVSWDDNKYPSIDAPLSLFFGAGTLYNRDSVEYLVKGFPLNIRYDYINKKVELSCYYPMPFFSSARFELAGIQPGNTKMNYEVRYEPLGSPECFSSYFHATYRDFLVTEPGKDMVFLDTRNTEGQKEWSGSFVGMSFIFSHNANLRTLEGDPRFFFDDSRSPQAYGTGTEEWGGGGDYWGGENMTLPFAGHPCGARKKDMAKDKKDLIESAYRFLLADLMPFGRRAVIRLEHGADNFLSEHYESVTYWYGLPSPSLIKTDSIDIGNITSEKKHIYYSPDASAVESISSRYEEGVNRYPADSGYLKRIPGYKDLMGKDVYPEHIEDGRYTRGISEFRVKLNKDNVGALLRRSLDYSFPNQTAEVFIEEADNQWEKVGTWYLAGSNTYVRSDPKGEADKRVMEIKTSNRQFRDDEFLIPSAMTKGKETIKIRIKFVANDQELFPGTPFPKKSAWSELRYEVYSYIAPKFSAKR